MSAASVAVVVTFGNATKERQAWCCLQVKLCDPCLSALCVPWCKKALYKYSSFPFHLITLHSEREVKDDKTSECSMSAIAGTEPCLTCLDSQ